MSQRPLSELGRAPRAPGVSVSWGPDWAQDSRSLSSQDLDGRPLSRCGRGCSLGGSGDGPSLSLQLLAVSHIPGLVATSLPSQGLPPVCTPSLLCHWIRGHRDPGRPRGRVMPSAKTLCPRKGTSVGGRARKRRAEALGELGWRPWPASPPPPPGRVILTRAQILVSPGRAALAKSGSKTPRAPRLAGLRGTRAGLPAEPGKAFTRAHPAVGPWAALGPGPPSPGLWLDRLTPAHED